MTKLESQNYYTHKQFNYLDLNNGTLVSSEFQDCTFSDCQFQQAKFQSCSFTDCTFIACDLSMFIPSKSTFRDVKFSKCRLLGVDWGKASWGKHSLHSLLKSLDFNDCVINFSSFMGLELRDLKLIRCIAHEVDFSEGDFSGADFAQTDLNNAIFRNTKLNKANFVGAANYMIDPGNNQISSAHFSLPEAMGLLYAMDIEITGNP